MRLGRGAERLLSNKYKECAAVGPRCRTQEAAIHDVGPPHAGTAPIESPIQAVWLACERRASIQPTLLRFQSRHGVGPLRRKTLRTLATGCLTTSFRIPWPGAQPDTLARPDSTCLHLRPWLRYLPQREDIHFGVNLRGRDGTVAEHTSDILQGYPLPQHTAGNRVTEDMSCPSFRAVDTDAAHRTRSDC